MKPLLKYVGYMSLVWTGFVVASCYSHMKFRTFKFHRSRDAGQQTCSAGDINITRSLYETRVETFAAEEKRNLDVKRYLWSSGVHLVSPAGLLVKYLQNGLDD